MFLTLYLTTIITYPLNLVEQVCNKKLYVYHIQYTYQFVCFYDFENRQLRVKISTFFIGEFSHCGNILFFWEIFLKCKLEKKKLFFWNFSSNSQNQKIEKKKGKKKTWSEHQNRFFDFFRSTNQGSIYPQSPYPTLVFTIYQSGAGIRNCTKPLWVSKLITMVIKIKYLVMDI
jgi:hypothetical protein